MIGSIVVRHSVPLPFCLGLREVKCRLHLFFHVILVRPFAFTFILPSYF